MGYSDNAYFKLVDGYALNTADGYSYTSRWVECQSFPLIDISVVFTGGSPAGTVKIQKSNDLQWTGGNYPTTLYSGGGQTPGTTAPVSDVADAPTGFGTNTVTVSGAGVYTLNQYNVGYHWFRVVFTASSNVVTQLDVFCTLKKL